MVFSYLTWLAVEMLLTVMGLAPRPSIGPAQLQPYLNPSSTSFIPPVLTHPAAAFFCELALSFMLRRRITSCYYKGLNILLDSPTNLARVIKPQLSTLLPSQCQLRQFMGCLVRFPFDVLEGALGE
jgi:hypothetical protein